ncbi:penicillin-binding transpeptidase domain-containing protein [Microtetraspora niveoalba]|uniref:penicillin-binding transpeptidase domain-containing protein n=1 Tax=Microtetraspora niveoalba TaxID=46175 RepID=UPI000AFC223C|nr:penicillin-binding transpeptidase domain-containing protein [Microtetraspora niveoalba]
MRRRALLALVGVVVAIIVTSVTGLVLRARDEAGAGPHTELVIGAPSSPPPSPTPEERRVEGTPEETAATYLDDWRTGDYESMRELVDEPPADFADRHRLLDDAVSARLVRLTPGEVTMTGQDTAEMRFSGSRKVAGYDGAWDFTSTLRLAVRDLSWKVLWSPAVMLPDLAEGGELVRIDKPVSATRFLTKEGHAFPHDNYAEPYLSELGTRIPPSPSGVEVGWTVEIRNPGQPSRVLLEKDAPAPKGTRTTIEAFTQGAAARALDPVDRPAALVAVRPSTGEVVAVADRLGGRGAFTGKYAPGSTFKTVTAAALLNGELTADSQVPCPATYTIPNGRTIENYQGKDHGTVTFRQAYALSCNTTFAQLAVQKVSADRLVEQAAAFGFGARLATGVGGTCGSLTRPENPDALAEASFGQGTVEASPLCMATVAAAVQSGAWRPPRLLPADAAERVEGHPQPASVPLSDAAAAGLRALMGAVTTEGTAAGSELPGGVSGKTGTAEDWQRGPDHAWFIGYQGDLAFAVFVEHGGTGRNAAVPVAARFLRAL